ncbi:sugar phosphate isomerase/epimerase [Enterococcus sp. 669A]|uniref:Sugar phosphate isomerase/epimerase n=1 Tax=Candidatus Enterococcus moelleringii TaxID=2815325 RepID=A0ABS3LBS4_9ENTE|nr:sugar phosphate isomerase/epimerase [Enterococcus sp. 669A]MBO1307087.1 sugar phosphate isomerase/epimerase [Enterococcus sp. 669A]
MKNIPVSIQVSLDTSGKNQRWKQQLQQYRLLGYSLIELPFEAFKQITPEVLAVELERNHLSISAIKVIEDFSIEEKAIEVITQLYQRLPKFPVRIVEKLQVIIEVQEADEELRVDLKAGYWHNLLNNLQLLSGFMSSVFSIETLIQPGREGLTAGKNYFSQLIQENHQLGLWMDTENVAYQQLDPLKVLQEWRGMIRSLHLRDVTEEIFSKGAAKREVETFLGEGVIDFGILYDELADNGLIQYVSVKPILPETAPDYWNECRGTLHYLREVGFN